MAKAFSTSSRVEPKKYERVERGDARFDETAHDGSPSEFLSGDRQAAKLPCPDKSESAGDSVEWNTRKDALQGKLPRSAHQQKNIISFSHALLAAGPLENAYLVAAKKPVNSRQGAESQVETAPSNEMFRFRANPAAAELLQQRQSLVFPEQPSIEACAKAGRSGDTFGGLYSSKAPDYSKSRKRRSGKLLFTLIILIQCLHSVWIVIRHLLHLRTVALHARASLSSCFLGIIQSMLPPTSGQRFR
jgi:hypothetical protein